MSERPTIVVDTIRALDLTADDVFRVPPTGSVWRLNADTSEWRKLTIPRWTYIYAAQPQDHGDDGDAQNIYTDLGEEYILVRVAVDEPNTTSGVDAYVILRINELVEVQRPVRPVGRPLFTEPVTTDTNKPDFTQVARNLVFKTVTASGTSWGARFRTEVWTADGDTFLGGIHERGAGVGGFDPLPLLAQTARDLWPEHV